MSVLKKFLAKPKTYVIEGEEIVLSPLKVKDMDLIMGVGNTDGSPNPKKLRDFVIATLKNSYPGEPVEDVVMTDMSAWLEACLDVHGFSADNADEELKKKFPNNPRSISSSFRIYQVSIQYCLHYSPHSYQTSYCHLIPPKPLV